MIFLSIKGNTQNCFECSGNTATGVNSAAFGENNNALGENSFTAGFSNEAIGFGAISLGRYCQSNGQASVTLGSSCYAAYNAWAIGHNAKAMVNHSFAIGRYVETHHSDAICIGIASQGYELINNRRYSLMVGFNSTIPALFVGNEWGYDFGRVGIGTIDPRAELDVNGGVICTGFALQTPNMQTGYVLKCNELGYADWAEADFSLWERYGSTENIFRPAGYVGIGNEVPMARLHLGDRWTFNDRDDRTKSIGYNVTYMSGEYYGLNEGPGSLLSFEETGAISFRTIPECIEHQPVSGMINTLFIAPDGKIGVGTETPVSGLQIVTDVYIGDENLISGEFGLYVERGIKTTLVRVDDIADWPDFVFNESYKLKSIKEIEDFILKNKHLPDIPSSGEIQENGINLAEMDAKLLRKIEELTLYLIEQDNTIKKQQKEIDELKEFVKSLN